MRFLTEDQRLLLQQDSLKANLLLTLFLEDGPFNVCDDVDDLTDGVTIWKGGSALLSAAEIKASGPLAAEGVTLVLDGTKMYQSGITNVSAVFNAFVGMDYHQRRVNIAFGFANIDSQNVELVVPVYAGKINHARVIDEGGDPDSGEASHSRLEIVLDSLAGRYRRATHRTRSHDDQLDLTNGTDQFFSFTLSASQAERTLYWGKAAPGGGAVHVAAGPGALWGS